MSQSTLTIPVYASPAAPARLAKNARTGAIYLTTRGGLVHILGWAIARHITRPTPPE